MRRRHSDSFAGDKSFQYGKSVSNQRIEAWWSFLKKDLLEDWVNYLKDFQYCGSYDSSDKVRVEALKLCFYGCLQSDLDEFWNNHRIRNSQNAHIPHNRTNIMYEFLRSFMN